LILAQDIGDSIALARGNLPMPEWQKSELQKRYLQYQQGKLELHDWQDMHEELRRTYCWQADTDSKQRRWKMNIETRAKRVVDVLGEGVVQGTLWESYTPVGQCSTLSWSQWVPPPHTYRIIRHYGPWQTDHGLRDARRNWRGVVQLSLGDADHVTVSQIRFTLW